MRPVVTEVINFLHELDLLEAHLDEHQHFIDKGDTFQRHTPTAW